MAVGGTSVTTPYTDTYLYRQDGAPLELLRQQSGTTSRYWYQVDGRGNVATLANNAGTAVADSYAYDLWGAPAGTTESVPQRFRYAGYWYDVELGWYWLGVRAHDPTLERFLEPDPSAIEGLYSYVYVGDNPIDGTDPSGLETIIRNPDGTIDADPSAGF